MTKTGAEIVIECLKEQKVDTVFGYPGGAILNLYDELYRHKDEIHHVLTSHEQGAAHAADGYARSTGKIGVCFATSGPGVANMVTGIATAHMDSIPMVVITCNVTLGLLGKDSFQEIDITGITMPITKHNFIVKDVKDLAPTLRRAFKIARTGRPGPVLVDIPKDITAAKTSYSPVEVELPGRISDTIDEKELARLAELIKKSKRPFIFVGGGAVISDCAEELKTFADKIDAPVCDSLMGKGAYDGTGNRYTGMLGMHGTKTSNFGVSECDLLIAMGTRFSDRVLGNPRKFASQAKIVHIDVDPAEINKNVIVDSEIIGDLKEVLKKLNKIIEKCDHKEWMDKIKEYRKKYPLTIPKGVLSGPGAIRYVYNTVKDDPIIVTEVGQHQMWVSQFYSFKKPHRLLTSGGLGTMGYGLGASIGAAIGNPGRRVINFAGDGCFRMNMNELATASRNNLPIIEIIMNNHVLGMVRQWQTLFYEKRYSATILDDGVDYVKVAEALGATGYRATSMKEFEEAFDKALKAKGPVVIDAIIGSDDSVWPMVAPGATLKETFDQSDLGKK